MVVDFASKNVLNRLYEISKPAAISPLISDRIDTGVFDGKRSGQGVDVRRPPVLLVGPSIDRKAGKIRRCSVPHERLDERLPAQSQPFSVVQDLTDHLTAAMPLKQPAIFKSVGGLVS